MRRRPLTVMVLGLAVALGVTACSGPTAETESPTSEAAAQLPTLDAAPADQLNLPAAYEGRAVMETDWHMLPEEVDGIFVGERLVGEEGEEIIEIVAVDHTGTILWTVEGPPVVLCSGTIMHTTRTADGRPIAIVTDVTSTESTILTPVLTAYDVQTGEPVWGPVEVPGFRRGPGLVYLDTKNMTAGEPAVKIAIDSTTGELLAEDTELQGRHIIAEVAGTLFTVDDTAITAQTRQADGSFTTVWSVPHAERGWNAEDVAHRSHPDDFGQEYLAIPSGPGIADIIRVDTGATVLAGVQHMKYDHHSGALIAATGTRVFGVHPGDEPWSYEAAEAQLIMGAGDGLGYLQGTGKLSAIDLRTGEPRTPDFTGGLDEAAAPQLPKMMSRDGAVVVEHQNTRYFVTA